MTAYLIAGLILLCLTFALAALMQGLKAGDEKFLRLKAEADRDETARALAVYRAVDDQAITDFLSQNGGLS